MKLYRWIFVCLWGAAGCATGQADDLSVLSDEFGDAGTSTSWSRVVFTEGWNADQLEWLDINTSAPGWLTMMPYTSTWYQDWRGELTYKEISGDFVATARVRTTGRDGVSAPARHFSLAGIMVRAPRDVTPVTWQAGGENYVFLSLGSADTPGTFQFEVKTTENSVSVLDISNAGSDVAEIQTVRLGRHFIMLQRTSGSWQVHRRYSRLDMESTTTLQVGMTCYTDWQNVSPVPPPTHNSTVLTGGNPDLIAQFDYFRFQRPNVPPALTNADFSNPAEVSDAQLLSFLGENVPVTLSGVSFD